MAGNDAFVVVTRGPSSFHCTLSFPPRAAQSCLQQKARCLQQRVPEGRSPCASIGPLWGKGPPREATHDSPRRGRQSSRFPAHQAARRPSRTGRFLREGSGAPAFPPKSPRPGPHRAGLVVGGHGEPGRSQGNKTTY